MLDQLKRRGWSLENRCFLCLAIEVSINHILIHCTKTRVLFVWCDMGPLWAKSVKKFVYWLIFLPFSVRETLFLFFIYNIFLHFYLSKTEKKTQPMYTRNIHCFIS